MMGFALYLSYLNTSWARSMAVFLKSTGYNKGTWEIQCPNAVPWGLVALDTRGTFTIDVPRKMIQFWCHDTNDSAGVQALCYELYDAPTSPWDKRTKTSDGTIYSTQNPAGEGCDLTWGRFGF